MKGLDHVKQEARAALGDNPDTDALIKWLVKERVIVEEHAVRFAMRVEFLRLASDRRFGSFKEVDQHVGEMFGFSHMAVYRARTKP